MKDLRQKDIVAILKQDRVINTIDIAARFGVSIETIRRDLDQLEKQGILKKVYGGAELLDVPTVMPAPLDSRRAAFRNDKLAIAARAITHVPDRYTIALDAGSTIAELCPLLREKKNLTIICDDIHSANALLGSGNKVYMMGGFLTPDGTTSGTFAKEFFNNIANIDLFLCSTDGASPEDGLSTDEAGINDLKKRYIKRANRRIALIDHSKFLKRAFYKMCDFTDLDLVITDRQTPIDVVEKLRHMGIPVEIA